MSRVSWRSVVYFTIVAVCCRASFSFACPGEIFRGEIFRKTPRGKNTQAGRIMPEHSVGQVFHTAGRDLYKSVYLTSDIMSQPR